MAETIILIEATQTRNYGIVQQTFKVSLTLEIEDSQQRQAAFKNLNTVIAQEFSHFEQNFMPKFTPTDDNEGEKVWSGGYISKSVENGVERYRLHTGVFTKYGVPVYPEILAQFPEFSEGEYRIELEQYGGKILMNDGKPKKVISCRFVQ